MKVYTSSGIYIKNDKLSIACDITRSKKVPLLFISHAHSDHIARHILSPEIICSPITAALLQCLSTVSPETTFYEKIELPNDIHLTQAPAGHIIGSTALKILTPTTKLIYTGDVSIRKKGYIEPFSPEKCDTLILDTTFGSPQYIFPPLENELKMAREQIKKDLEDGTPVVLMGYALGKSQILYHHYADLSDICILQGSNYKINSVLCKCENSCFIDGISYQEAKEKKILEKNKNWIFFGPLKSGRNQLYAKLKRNYGAKLYAFSGWARNSGYKYRMAVDHSYIISDHADYNELLDICFSSSPEKIYTIYGAKEEFAGILCRKGFNATPLSKQKTLDTFFN